MLHLHVDPQFADLIDEERLHRAVETALRAEQAPPHAALSLVIVGDEEMSRLHLHFRGEEGPTDVLTFPADEMPAEADEEIYLGDIIVCWPQAERQAAEYGGHQPHEELELLAVHGVLHLLGYDDEEETARRAMWARQAAIMEQLGLGHIAPRDGSSTSSSTPSTPPHTR
ncbi:rRNA maturation RNase YbeY [Ardenticatena maritima]|uniref:rRNA maturation RNase YbeY n=1 Tax=Ardenticatena maritima TaxID=872965 RepID=UPI0009EC02E1|nr:rRNA maturation RNase YbeY [Ardenticatena maritima]